MRPEPSLTAQVQAQDGVARIALNGDLDMETLPVLQEQLARLEGEGVKAIVLDLGDLTFVDSTGLHAFVEARDRARTHGHRFLLTDASPAARRLFELTGMQSLMDEL